MRAPVISDTHFGAWTSEDIFRHDHELALLAAHLDDVDEVVFLSDLFDFQFASVRDAIAVAEGLFAGRARSRGTSGWSSGQETTITNR